MSILILNYKSYFFEWSTVSDSPVSGAMILDEFREYYKAKYGEKLYSLLQARIERALQTGVSSYSSETFSEFVAFNRAGDNEAVLAERDLLLKVGVPEYCICSKT